MSEQAAAANAGALVFEAAGKTCRLKYGYSQMIAVEDKYDKAFQIVLAELQGAPRLSVLQEVFAAGLLVEGEKPAPEVVVSIIDEIGLAAVSTHISTALEQSPALKVLTGETATAKPGAKK